MTNIILSKEAILKNAVGTHINHLSKPVLCITTKEKFASVTDAAEAYGVSVFSISNACNGKMKTCKGKRFCFVADRDKHFDEILNSAKHTDDEYDKLKMELEELRKRNNELEADAVVGRAIRKQEELKRKEEEARQQALNNANEAVEKANKKVNCYQRMVARKDAELQAYVAGLMKAEKEQANAEQKLLELEGKVKA